MIGVSPAAKIVWNLLDISVLLNKYGEIISREAGITTQQWLIMLYLAEDPNIPFLQRERHDKPLTASELATALNVSRPNITNLVGSLLGKGYVRQTEDEDDRRKKRIVLTAAGRELVHRLEPNRSFFNTRLLKGFSGADVAKLLTQLEELNRTIREDFRV